ncbi:glycoside hydrolase family 43 protein [Lutibacter sp. HS1-25]|uniref:glycoside hydrolase family 43 protein n=1 Tax=Lutibacter sp. HS1-25 TaxID=2485000 RepID=UPI001011D239|nr:glycoside hydrolase family 43 protein [Lutibacter sp. HS1-25]RXP62718.1 glycoside hydrolase family 43 protein [Lutibacter sp. HS1-25]
MKRLNLIIVAIVMVSIIHAQNAPETFQNPIIPGFHPDPSITRVGDDYYLVNSSFNMFPGIPIFHSKDLVNWQQIGNVLDRPEQLLMKTPGNGGGIWAPTIRYHDGLYYVIVTCKQCINDCGCGDNFYVTAKDPKGPWSNPIWVDTSHGIDPTIFWDDDGKTYYVGSTHDIGGPQEWDSQDRIYISEIDLKTGKLISEPILLTTGHATNAKFAEGPHIYKIKNKYLLMISEGGTWNNHAITTFEADKVTGPYKPTQVNPVLTHRHLGNNFPITTVGHADLVQTQNGDWWSVMLACRPIEGKYYLGRETFLTPVKFEGVIPIFNEGIGQVLLEDKRPDLTWHPFNKKTIDDFEDEKLGFEWNFIRTPLDKWYNLKKGNLEIKLRPEKITDKNNPSFIGRRLEYLKSSAITKMNFKTSKENEVAGLVTLQNENFQYQLLKTNKTIELIKVYNADRKIQTIQKIAVIPYKKETVVLKVENDLMTLRFYAGETENSLVQVGADQDASVISSSVAGGFIGAYIGMYASSNSKKSTNKASFDCFEYKPF